MSTEAKPVSPAELTGPLIEGMPEPTKEITDVASFNAAPGESPVSETSSPVKGSGVFDSKGQEFDPNYHTTNPDGTPKRNASGNFYKKHAKWGAGVTRAQPGFAGIDAQGTITPQQHVNAEKLAKMMVPMCDRFGKAILSEGAALSDEEKTELTNATVLYIETTKLKDIPPGIALAMVFTSIYAEKCSKPSVRERLTLYAIKFKKWFGSKIP